MAITFDTVCMIVWWPGLLSQSLFRLFRQMENGLGVLCGPGPTIGLHDFAKGNGKMLAYQQRYTSGPNSADKKFESLSGSAHTSNAMKRILFVRQ